MGSFGRERQRSPLFIDDGRFWPWLSAVAADAVIIAEVTGAFARFTGDRSLQDALTQIGEDLLQTVSQR